MTCVAPCAGAECSRRAPGRSPRAGEEDGRGQGSRQAAEREGCGCQESPELLGQEAQEGPRRRS